LKNNNAKLVISDPVFQGIREMSHMDSKFPPASLEDVKSYSLLASYSTSSSNKAQYSPSAIHNQSSVSNHKIDINISHSNSIPGDMGKNDLPAANVIEGDVEEDLRSTAATGVVTATDSYTIYYNSPKNSPKSRMFNSPKGRMFNSPKLAPRVLFKSPMHKHLAASFRREKNNSTSTLFINDTFNNPNVDEILRCMAVALLYHIKNGVKASADKLDRVFSEKYYPLTKEYFDFSNLPDVTTIYRFINLIFRVQKLPHECAILCLAFIERILSGDKIVLHPENWRRIVFGSLMMATKVWEDESVWNVDFLDLFPLLTLNDLNNTENRFLELLQFNVIINGSEYAKYYFELRALSQLESFPLQPLNKEMQAKLEERSQKLSNQKVPNNKAKDRLNNLTPKRSKSVDTFDPKSPPIVIG